MQPDNGMAIACLNVANPKFVGLNEALGGLDREHAAPLNLAYDGSVKEKRTWVSEREEKTRAK